MTFLVILGHLLEDQHIKLQSHHRLGYVHCTTCATVPRRIRCHVIWDKTWVFKGLLQSTWVKMRGDKVGAYTKKYKYIPGTQTTIVLGGGWPSKINVIGVPLYVYIYTSWMYSAVLKWCISNKVYNLYHWVIGIIFLGKLYPLGN